MIVKRLNRFFILIIALLLILGVLAYFFIYKIDFLANNSKNTLEVTYDYQDKMIPHQTSITKDSKASKPANPVYPGFTFDGWYSDKELEVPFSFNQILSRNTTIYASFIPINYSINYILGIGEFLNGDYKTIFTSETPTFLLPEAFRLGSEFIGWYNQVIGGKQISYISKGTTGNITLYARFASTLDLNFYAKYTIKHYTETIGESGVYALYNTQRSVAKLGSIVKGYPLEIPLYYTSVVSISKVLVYGLVIEIYYDLPRYSVEFFDNGVLRSVVSVPYGSAANPPSLYYNDPDTYSWDKSFNYITESLVVNALHS
ncbi:MAG: InlB B-repeat-containing protein [Acholeplasmatales bacterium]|jgi:uncharacterized repeat protein (TIGR02543 family)|nr:InlB B-repeat-containing protein [Acholeplasmatales bacterium]